MSRYPGALPLRRRSVDRERRIISKWSPGVVAEIGPAHAALFVEEACGGGFYRLITKHGHLACLDTFPTKEEAIARGEQKNRGYNDAD